MLTGCVPCRSLLVAAVEGEASLMIFDILQHRLRLQHRVQCTPVPSPTMLAFDSHDNLWIVGGCVGKLGFAIECLSKSSLLPGVSPP